MAAAQTQTDPRFQRSDSARTRWDRGLFDRVRAGDVRARDELVGRFLPLARSLARRYERSSEPMDDLVQVASLGLVKAIDRFDPTQGYTFSSFAVPTIVGELKRHFRDRAWIVRPPRALQERTLQIARVTSELAQKLDRAPTVGELATALDCDEEQVLEALQAGRGRAAISLQSPAGNDDDPRELQDMLGGFDEGLALAESRVMLASLGAGLSPRSLEVLRLRFDQDMTQTQIGERLGVSQMQISRILRQALAHMRRAAEQASTPDD
jgi:RNA polymerase sigma-B factor